MPAPLEADCQPLRLRVDPNRVASAPRKPAPLPTRASEKKVLLQLGTSAAPGEVCAQINGDCQGQVVDTESRTWSGVKSLYR